MNLDKAAAFWALALSAAAPSISHADMDWGVGNVILIEDVLGHWPDNGILVNLGNKTYYGTGAYLTERRIDRYLGCATQPHA